MNKLKKKVEGLRMQVIQYRVRNLDNKKYLKKFDWFNSLPVKVEWTKDINDAMILGERTIAPVMNYLRKVKHCMVTFEDTEVPQWKKDRLKHAEHVKNLVKRNIQEKHSIIKTVEKANKITREMKSAIDAL